ncbi:acyl-CoA dehydrogenase family protein [Streptantibioticus silvisoli]|uniref:Acyl-CoA dehydrogenase family protein n=1 Tax=Streptantibioticus silvisoli TaxID=2705255 RepID=A0ABT6VXU2_9ACTN|nr:acyl-CoA dehydrogenase family protein [Streptantibioticus silvisoli]MDI5963290.1 acyl-CoA dehydrogenase family protein [Streptantibioticus silvisoli]
MDFSRSAEQQQRYARVKSAARDLSAGSSAAGFRRRDWTGLAAMGLLGAAVPQEYGGSGFGALDTALLFEAAGEGCADNGLLFAAAAHLFACVRPLVEFASEGIRKALLPALCSGEWIAGNAMTEPESGSDVSRLATRATKVDGGYLLDGVKSFVSNGPVADLYVTYATTDPQGAYFNTTAFAVDKDSPGLVAGPPMEKSGLTTCQSSQVVFTRCFVPDDRVIASPGQGQLVFQTSMQWERCCLFAIYLGQQERLIGQCVQHVRERRQFGKRLADIQPVADRLAEMRLRLESGRLLLYRACAEIDSGQDPSLWISLAKLAVSEAAVATALDATRIFGGRGYLKEYGIEEQLRDALPATTFSGTSDIQRQLIARGMGL